MSEDVEDQGRTSKGGDGALTDDDFLRYARDERRRSIGFGEGDGGELVTARERALRYAKLLSGTRHLAVPGSFGAPADGRSHRLRPLSARPRDVGVVGHATP